VRLYRFVPLYYFALQIINNLAQCKQQSMQNTDILQDLYVGSLSDMPNDFMSVSDSFCSDGGSNTVLLGLTCIQFRQTVTFCHHCVKF
jgi:hypothetical protein